MNYKYFLVLFLYTGNAFSQNSGFGAWYMYFGNNPIAKHMVLHNEVQYRNFDAGGDLEQLLIRTGVGYDITEGNDNLLLGYGYILSKPYINYKKTENSEHRIFQQYMHKHSIGRLHLLHRFRLEERFTESGYKTRFRYFLSLNVPLNKKKMEKKAAYFSAYSELFIQPESPVFDRNRLYVALGYKLSDGMRIESGCMFQMYENSRRGQFQLALFNTIPFYSN